jgi:hypothetical protein
MIVSLNYINRSVFLIEMQCALLCDVQTKFLNIIYMNLKLKRISYILKHVYTILAIYMYLKCFMIHGTH